MDKVRQTVLQDLEHMLMVIETAQAQQRMWHFQRAINQ